jgi:hypothetical protein
MRFFIVFAVFLIFALARRYMSATAVKPPAEHYSQEELNSRFGNTQWIVGLSIAVVGVLFAWSTHAAFIWLNHYLATFDGPTEFQLWPQSAIWWFFPGFGALTLSWEIVLQLWAALGSREEAQLYDYWSIQKTGFNATKLIRWMAVVVTLPIAILTILALSVHASLRRDDIRDCGYAFAPCKTYRYSAALRMTTIEGFRDRDGKLTRRAGIVIDFSDGRRWSSADIGDFKDSVDPAVASFLQSKTHLQYEDAETQADIPQLNVGFQPKAK